MVLVLNLAVIGLCVTGLWLLSLRMRDASIVDIFWGLGFVLVAWTTLLYAWLYGGPAAARSWLLAGLTTVWGLRLGGYLAWRNLGKGEDYRYRAMRDRFGNQFWWVSLLVVFGLQGAIMWVVALPLQFGIQGTGPLGWLDAAGGLVWAVGLFFESTGDYQMARFKSNPENRGQVCDTGLWRYTRHPNYFGDFLVWWGLFLICVAGNAPWWTVVSPALMSFLLIRVSGVRLLESSLKARTAGYQDYVNRTSAFFPWPVRGRETGDGG